LLLAILFSKQAFSIAFAGIISAVALAAEPIKALAATLNKLKKQVKYL